MFRPFYVLNPSGCWWQLGHWCIAGRVVSRADHAGLRFHSKGLHFKRHRSVEAVGMFSSRYGISNTSCIYMSPDPGSQPPPQWYGPPPPPPIPHTFCARHCNKTYISIFLHARRCSETHIFILLDEPSRRIRWVDRAKLWRNANFKLQEVLRAVYRTSQCSANGIIDIYTYTGTYPYTYIYIHIHTYTYIYIHIHTYTYIYIHIHKNR